MTEEMKGLIAHTDWIVSIQYKEIARLRESERQLEVRKECNLLEIHYLRDIIRKRDMQYQELFEKYNSIKEENEKR